MGRKHKVVPAVLHMDVSDEEAAGGPEAVKRLRMESGNRIEDLRNVLADILRGVECVTPEKFSEIMTLMHDRNVETRWYASQCVSAYLKLSDVEKRKLINQFDIPSQMDMELGLDFQLEFERKLGSLSDHETELPPLTRSLFTPSTVKNGAISVRKLKIDSKSDESVYILTDSYLQVIRELCRELGSDRLAPVCVYGPTGTGKSTVVQLTASLFKRCKYPDVITVQMSDQIDARLLLGSYHSTDLPGQFVWKAGCLTKAVLNGHWIVLEDLDSASADVITLFDGLIDSGRLSVPGYGEIKKFHSEFRIISTCRTFGGSGDKRLLDKIGRHWKQIGLETLGPMDLKIILVSLFPHLRNLAEKLSTIFLVMEEAKQGRGTKNRLLSLRDFHKLCRRIPKDLDFTKPASAVKIFQEAFDLFVASLYDPVSRKEVAEKLGAHLNILLANVEYFCGAYKPTISIDINGRKFTAGRYTVPMLAPRQLPTDGKLPVFSLTKRASCLLELICSSVHQGEPVLLLGETGVGKTSCIQYLAQTLSQKLIVVNLNRQSDSSDLLGGYKPVELKYIFGPLREEFETNFARTFNKESNRKFLDHVMTSFANKQWTVLVKLLMHVQRSAILRHDKFKDHPDLLQRWINLGNKLSRVDVQLNQGHESPFAFSFIEGTLIEAIRHGYWILLDEINLATPEMLQCLAGALESHAQIHLWEKGDEAPIRRHKNFHLFAAMNPSTDVGKKDLPLGLRNRFTEYFVDELTDPDELQVLVSDYLREMALSSEQIQSIVGFYLTVRKKAEAELVDGTGKKPHFSLRTLCRALKIASQNLYGSVSRSLYESFCISFLTQLDYSSHPVVQRLIARHIFGTQDPKAVLNHALPKPAAGQYVNVEGYWIPKGDLPEHQPENYILTPSIRRNLKDIARIVSAGKLPVLIQGETSVGKTSLIQYLAQVSGNRCYRINNHQHTDLQEYIGSYQSDDKGKLVFTEGVLVQAMRRGEWIILDELNLAPSEVLEALNRLLDDNRQLFITETGVTVTAHPRFMLFATQNPPGLYGGRKLLSRAFRNRFVELHFDEIPSSELETILNLRCAIPPSYCKKIIGVMKELQMRRKSSAALQGKHGFATLRDLFRWAERYRLSDAQQTKFYDWDQHLADDGYLVLAGRVRKEAETEVIREVLKRHFKRTVEPYNLFSLHEKTSSTTKEILEMLAEKKLSEFGHIVWTFQMRRLAVLIGNAIKFKEPVLLVGETGCGKTTVVQVLANLFQRKLFSVNCHMHSEGSDFLGGLRPIRNREDDDERLFEWINGPLVEAMQQGGIFLADEISLADDSVLERINSVLEPERTLLISEKGDETPQLITAHENFQFVGTMNPGGDYGKKELSPALRNRLTEIWCPVTTDSGDLSAIIEHNLNPDLQDKGFDSLMIYFCEWLQHHELCSRVVVSIRDYLAWAGFINKAVESDTLSMGQAIVQGACLTFLDGLGSGNTSVNNIKVWAKAKEDAMRKIEDLAAEKPPNVKAYEVTNTETEFGIGEFKIPKTVSYYSKPVAPPVGFAIEAPTTCLNGLRLLRAMQLEKPILLEGSPGVGKTAIVTALAKYTNNSIVRINLSEQTDISDLFGADLPVEGETGGHFAWRDGPLLQALKDESWILLDELNLASQSVLEGLNACLDHRGEIYVPELNRTFHLVGKCSRIFACQNPVRQGGARKGLPKSFLNRFTQVFIDPLGIDDLEFVVRASYPALPTVAVRIMTRFSEELNQQVCVLGSFGARGAPWDFNLRDLLRWAELVYEDGKNENLFVPDLFVDTIYGMRMRSREDREAVLQLYSSVKSHVTNETFDEPPVQCGQSDLIIMDDKIVCGKSELPRICDDGNQTKGAGRSEKLVTLNSQLSAVESVIKCLQMGWMPILVGPSGAGKSSVIKLVAQLCGRDLQIMTPSPEMDTIELLGGFEQADIYRRIDELTADLSALLLETLRWIVVNKEHLYGVGSGSLLVKEDVYKQWEELVTLDHLAPNDGMGQHEELVRIEQRVDFLKTSYLKCKSFLESSGLIRRRRRRSSTTGPDSETDYYEERNFSGTLPYPRNSNEDGRKAEEEEEEAKGEEEKEDEVGEKEECNRFGEMTERVCRELQDIHTHLTAGIQTGGFHWIHSLLIKALLKGDWLLIDGANRCTSAVLDRLNSLLEPNGKLFLSERGTVEGEIQEIRPHPNFRLILAMNPSYGEISRAMRNRGVEIYLPGDNAGMITMEGQRKESRGLTSMTTADETELSLCVENFISSRWLRVWKELAILRNVSMEDVEPVQIGGLEITPEGLLTVSVFARSLSSDLEALSMALRVKRPWISPLLRASNMEQAAKVALSLGDLQYDPHFVAKYTGVVGEDVKRFVLAAVKCSLMVHRNLFPPSWEFKNKRSLGFLAEYCANGNAVSEFESNMDIHGLLVGFWEVWVSLCNVAGVLLETDGETEWKVKDEVGLGELAELWLKGVKTLIWIQRVANVARTELNKKKSYENLMANLRLLLQWVGADIVPALKKLKVSGKQEYERSLRGMEVAVRMLQEEERSNSDMVRAEEILREKCFAVNPLRIMSPFEEVIPAFLMTVFDVWSSRSIIPAEKWPEVLDQDLSATLHVEVSHRCMEVINNGMLDSEIRNEILRFAERFCREENSMETEPGVRRGPDVLKLNLFGLTELLRLANRRASTGETWSSSVLTNPIQVALSSGDINNSGGSKENMESLVKYLSWDERTRFVKTFVSFPVGSISTACLLPYFTSRILVDTTLSTRITYRSCSLGTKKEMMKTLEKVGKNLHEEVFRQKRRACEEILDEMTGEFAREVSTVCSELTNTGVVGVELSNSVKKIEDSRGKLGVTEKMVALGEVMIEVAGLLMDVISQLPLVDPAVKKRFMAGWLSEDVSFFRTWRAVQEQHQLTRIGCNLPSQLAHPFVTAAANYVLICEQLLSATTQNIPDRPEEPQYGTILRDLRLFVGSFCSSKLKGLAEQIKVGFSNGSPTSIEPLLVASQNWIEGHQNFAVKLSGRVWYWDIVAPALLISSWASAGLALMTDAMRQKCCRPSEEFLHTIEELVSFPVSTTVGRINEKELSLAKHMRMKLLLADVQTVANQIESRGSLSSDLVKEFYELSETFASAWRNHEEEQQRKQTEEDSMYIYKGKERTLTLTEEEEEAKSLKEVFPSFVGDFQDLIEPKDLGDSTTVQSQPSVPGADSMDSKDMAFFIRIQARVSSFVSNRWISSRADGTERNMELVTPFMHRFQIGCYAYENLARVLGVDDEKRFAVGAEFALAQLRQIGGRGKVIHDVYHEPCVEEIEKLPSVFLGLRKRVNELLEEWPEHPSLNKIIVMMDRLESFPLDTPLMKFLTGLELLLEICQEWERNAHSGVSIAMSLMEVTQLIIEWRKLELSFWKNLVETTHQREQENAYRWWLYITSTVEEIARNFGEADPDNAMTEFLKSLQMYMESSPLGQYETRLNVLYQIHCFMVAKESYGVLSSPVPMVVHAAVWNTIKFYEEFRPGVRSRLNNLRAPIEKKMKDFVKICRWNDMNFSSLKDSVNKSQKQLSKLVREFKQVLAIPAKSMMVADEKLPAALKKFDMERKVFVADEDEVIESRLEIVEQLFKSIGITDVSARAKKIYGKMRNIAEGLVESRIEHYREQLGSTEGVIEDIIAASNDLQQTDVQEKGDKRKQFLHHVHSRRRLTLAGLFKSLTQLNLSYRRGLSKLQGKTDSSGATVTMLHDFLIEPHDLAAAWKNVRGKHFEKSDKLLIKLWSAGTESSFQSSVIRMVSLIKAFQSPNKQLSLAIIERCKGYAADLQAQIAREKAQIAVFSKFVYETRLLMQNVDNQMQEKILSKAATLEFEFCQWKLVVELCESDLKQSLSSVVGSVLSACKKVKEEVRNSATLANCLKPLRKLDMIQMGTNSLVEEAVSSSLASLSAFCDAIEEEIINNAPAPTLDLTAKQEVGQKLSKLMCNAMLTFQQLEPVKLDHEENSVKDTVSSELSAFSIAKVVELLEGIRKVKSTELINLMDSFRPVLERYVLLSQFYLTQLVAIHRQNSQLLNSLCCLFITLAQKGFNLPPDYEDEGEKEGPELDAKGGLGLGEGETTPDAQDVSDRIESEDQLEETLKPGESSNPADQNLDESEKGIEMPEDFEGEMQDKADKGGDEEQNNSDDDNKSEDEGEPDKQMGDVDDPNADKLDEQMWGGSSDEEEDDLEETGDKGGETQKDSEPELKAKDPEFEDTEGPESKEQRQQPQPEMDEEGEPNDDQIDPYHGEEPNEQEPEDFDLPENVNLDDQETKENEEESAENPFDLDQEKQQEEFKDLDAEEKEEDGQQQKDIENEEKEVDKDDMSEDGDQAGVDVEPMEQEDPIIEQQNKCKQPEEQLPEEQPEPEEQEDEKEAEDQTAAQDDSKTVDEKAEASEELKEQIDENVQGNESKKAEGQVTVEEHEPDDKDEAGTGQAESKTGVGHEGKMATKEDQKAGGEEKEEKEAARKPGDTDRKRTLAALDQSQSKRLKTVDNPDADDGVNPEDNAQDEDSANPTADLYQHISQGEKSDAVTMDDATMDQAEQQKQPEPVPESEETPERENSIERDLMADDDIEFVDSDKTETKGKPSDSKKGDETDKDDDKDEGTEEPVQMEVDGVKVATYTVQRPTQSSIHTRNELFFNIQMGLVPADLVTEDDEEEAGVVALGALDTDALSKWHQLESITLPLAQELCEQLRLILEPTLAARLRGDYKTGKRLNMRKVIPYVASGFRKDKIWLRRTQPSKREYQILLALDDSASMSDNQSKQMAFSAVAVVAKALSLLESGQLSVVSFGEQIDVMHSFDEPFTDMSGAHLLESFKFAQRQTRIAQLMSFVTKSMVEQKNRSQSSTLQPDLAQLVLIISDGRNVSSEGKDVVEKAIRRAREENIFMVFVIVDNPANKDSILDIRYAEFDEKNNLKCFNYYMDHFPFPFYLILRDLNSLPSVLSDALRQWFELVTSSER